MKGFFKSITSLKSRDPELSSSKTFQELVSDHDHDLLKSIKPSVIDLHSISALHYLNGGDNTIIHFQHIINAVLSDVKNFALTEINQVYAIILRLKLQDY